MSSIANQNKGQNELKKKVKEKSKLINSGSERKTYTNESNDLEVSFNGTKVDTGPNLI